MKNGYELRRTAKKGEGVFATRTFLANEIVMIGRIKQILAKNDSHATQMDESTYVRHAGLMPKVNHSCNPNCGIKVNKTNAHDLVAIHDISIGEEITFDYAMRNYTIAFFPNNCTCGSKQCRGHITGWKDLPEQKKQEYKGFFAPYLHELDDNRQNKRSKKF